MRVTPIVHLRKYTKLPHHSQHGGASTIYHPDIEAAAFTPDVPSEGAHASIVGGSTGWVYPNRFNDSPETTRVSPEEVAKVEATGEDPDDHYGDRPIMPHPAGGHARATSSGYGKHLLEDPEFQRTGNAPLWYQTHDVPPMMTSLFGTSRGARATHALLGVMGQTAKNLYGRLPVPDGSLSTDSSKIAKRLLDKGVVEPNKFNPEAKVTNTLGRKADEYEQSIQDHYIRDDVRIKLSNYPRVSEEDVLRGQQFMSKALHPAKAPAPAAAEAVDRAEAVASPQAVDKKPEPTLFDRDWNKD